MAEIFSATIASRFSALKLTQSQNVGNAAVSSRFNALRLTQQHILPVAAPNMLALASTAGLGGTTYAVGAANAETSPEVATYRIGDVPIGQWTVGTDYVAATASTTRYVQLQQNIADFEVAVATQGHTVVAPTQNETSNTVQLANATQGLTAEPVVFTQAHTAPANSAELGYTVAAPSVVQPSAVLGVDSPNTMGTEVFAPDLTSTNQALSVAVAEVGYTVAAPNLFLIPNVPTPAERTFIPAAEDRTFTPVAEDRTFALAA
jgi:hypothetical protein